MKGHPTSGVCVNFQRITFIIALLTLASCGRGGHGEANLEITHGFATGNSSFDGGLFIHGKNTASGEEFSIALTAQQKATVSLSFGTWDIRSIGWDNDPGPFKGDVLCARETLTFRQSGQSLKLQVSNAKCNDVGFASNGAGGYVHEPAVGVYSFKPLKVYTCGALYDVNSPTDLRASNFAESFCEDSYPKGMVKKAQGIKVKLHNRPPGKGLSEGITSACLPRLASTGNPSGGIRLPTKIPVTVELYESDDCVDSLQSSFHFPQGIEHGMGRDQLGFDAILKPATNLETALALPFPISKRGSTPFLTEMPFFRCNFLGSSDAGSPCLGLPSLPSGKEFVLGTGITTIRFAGGPQCGSSTFSYSGGTGVTENSPGCYHKNGDLYLSVNVAPGATDGTIFYGASQGDAQIIPDRGHIYRELMGSIGYSALDAAVDSFPSTSDDGEEDRQSGVFSNPREMLSPMVLGGFYWDRPCSTTSPTTPVIRNVTFYEDGEAKQYQAIMTAPPSVNAPRFILNGDPRTLNDGNPFNRRFIIRGFEAAYGYKTRMVMDIACDNDTLHSNTSNIRIGRIEEYHNKVKASEEREERHLMYWNTGQPGNARYESYSMESVTDPISGEVRLMRTSFEKGEKFPGGTNNSALRLTRLNYEHHFNEGSPSPGDESWIQRLNHSESDILDNNITYKNTGGIEFTSSIALLPGDIFNGNLVPEEMELERYGAINSMTTDVGGFKSLPNGKFVRAHQDGNDLKLELFNGLTYIPHSQAMTVDRIAADLSHDGSKALVVATVGSYLHVFTFNGTWTYHPQVTAISSLTKLKASILNSGDYMIAAVDPSQKVHYIVEQIANNPASFPASSFYNSTFDKIKDIAVVKTQNKLHLILHHVYESSAFPVHITHCAVTYPDTCASVKTDILTEGGGGSLTEDLTHMSASSTTTGVIIGYGLGNPSTTVEISARKSTDEGVTWGSDSPSLTAADIVVKTVGGFNFDTTAFDSTPTVALPVQVPYVQPSAPGFRINYRSLNPAQMVTAPGTSLKTFTETETFKNIAQ